MRLLRASLWANVAFSTLSGASILAAAPWIAQHHVAWPAGLLRLLGLGLLLFAATVAVVARAPQPTARSVRSIVLADAGWVVATPVALLAWPDGWSAGAAWTAVAVAVVVADLAVGQSVGLRRAGKAA